MLNQFEELADYMERGAKIRPQAYGGFFEYRGSLTHLSCAMGAVFESFFGELGWDSAKSKRLHGHFPILECWLKPAFIPVRVREFLIEGKPTLVNIILKLNDKCKISREEIAAWLRTLDLSCLVEMDAPTVVAFDLTVVEVDLAALEMA